MIYRLFDLHHTQITIYQVIDDATRLDVGTQAFATHENGTDARTVLDQAMKNYGVPQEILSDNGDAFATYHRGYLSQTEVWLASLGVVSIAGFAPTTQGKDERSHKTLTAFLDARHPTSLQEVTRFLVDYRHHYNTKRRHQGLVKGRFHLTPQEAWEAFPKAEPPTSPVNPDVLWNKIATYYKDTIADSAGPAGAATPTDPHSTTSASHQDTISTAPPSVSPSLPTIPGQNPWGLPAETTIDNNGVVSVCGTRVYVGMRFKNRRLATNITEDTIAEFYTIHDAELLFSFPLPIICLKKPTSQININYIQGMWHRQPPTVMKNLEGPRPPRGKSRKKARKFHC